MKKSLVLISGFALALSALPLLAEETIDVPPHKNKSEEVKNVKGKGGPFAGLELTQEQREKIKAIMEEGKATREALEKEREALRKKTEAFHEAQKAKMKAVLTPEQMKKLEEMKDKMEPGKPGKFGKPDKPHKPGKGPNDGDDKE